MAAGAQNQLGQLFIDLGVGGVGKTLKALNTVSATFLLTKNMATQMIKPMVDIGKQSLNSAVEIGKLSASFGTSLVEAQKFAYYLKEKNLSEGLLGDLSSMQTKFAQIRAGFAGVDGQMAMSMNMLGLDWQDYDGSSASMLQYVKDVQNAVKGMETQTARMHLQNLGLGNSDWLYAFQRGDFNLNDSLRIDDNTILNFIKTQEQLNKLGIEIDQVKQKAVSAILNKGGMKILNNAVNSLQNANTPKDAVTSFYKNTDFYKKPEVQKFHKTVDEGKEIAKTINTVNGLLFKTFYSNLIPNIPVPAKNDKSTPRNKSLSYNLPDAFSNLNQPSNQMINITNDISVSGENAQEIADKIASISAEQIQQLQYNQYQSYNVAGV